MKPAFKYIYGPVPSWRLGSSLGIDLLSQEEKICNFDCVYCQLGVIKKYTTERKIHIPVEKVIEELEALPNVSLDYITFSGFGSILKGIKEFKKGFQGKLALQIMFIDTKKRRGKANVKRDFKV